jgi:hypothetical protein
MCMELLCGDSGITITVSLINYCCNTSARRREGLIEILPLKLCKLSEQTQLIVIISVNFINDNINVNLL